MGQVILNAESVQIDLLVFSTALRNVLTTRLQKEIVRFRCAPSLAPICTFTDACTTLACGGVHACGSVGNARPIQQFGGLGERPATMYSHAFQRWVRHHSGSSPPRVVRERRPTPRLCGRDMVAAAAASPSCMSRRAAQLVPPSLVFLSGPEMEEVKRKPGKGDRLPLTAEAMVFPPALGERTDRRPPSHTTNLGGPRKNARYVPAVRSAGCRIAIARLSTRISTSDPPPAVGPWPWRAAMCALYTTCTREAWRAPDMPVRAPSKSTTNRGQTLPGCQFQTGARTPELRGGTSEGDRSHPPGSRTRRTGPSPESADKWTWTTLARKAERGPSGWPAEPWQGQS